MISNSSARRLLTGSALPSLASIALLSLAAPAFAQTATAAADADQAPQEIVVTGSILRRTSTETPSPVTTLSSQTLEQRGINTIAEAAQRLAANGAGTMTQGWNNGSNFATGANAVSLRGLTVQSTLVVFDGLRMAPYPLADDGHRNFVDLNTIPEGIVDKIEVLKDGASSTYGADAIAGVVNVIMKKQITGFHIDVSNGISGKGDGAEHRVTATAGYGDLAEQGFNFYVNAEYQKNSPIYARDRGYPFNSSDLSRVCDGSSHCLPNGDQFGINADGTLGAGTTIIAPLVAPSSATGARQGFYRLLNPTAGCGIEPGLTPVTLTAAQAGTTWSPNLCTQDLRAQYQTIQPRQQRYGFAGRLTVNISDHMQAFAMANYYNVTTHTTLTPLGFANQTTAPRVVSLSPVLLPVYVCAGGVGTIVAGVNQSTGCTAANGTLNPNNPFAAAGQNAILRWRYDRPRDLTSDASSLRLAGGVSGDFGDDWNYSANVTYSQVRLNLLQKNYMIPQRIADVVATGAFNFVNPLTNSETVRDYIAPNNRTVSLSKLFQAEGTISKKLFELPGGPLQLAVGAAYRSESINNPSANPDNTFAPYTRYYAVNAVGAIGSRNVKSAFFEVDAPILDQLEINASGRYDKYSSGQKNFSPKIGGKFTPIKQIALRGTFSKGFRIPSFNEAYGLPTTGFSTSTVNCTTFAAWCTSHGNNSYATAPYSLGTTAVGNPALKPEKSQSYTAGTIFEPKPWLSFTADYWHIKVKGLISQVSAGDRAAAINQYYSNNGVISIPGLIAVPAVADPQFPNALPLLGSIQFSYNNSDSEVVSGVDLGANATIKFANGWKLNSSVDASYLIKYNITRTDGTIEKYAGTLSPCDYTSCSGSPKWRFNWQNTVTMGKATVSGTLYYTGGYDLAEVDYGGIKGDCVASAAAAAGSPFYKGTTIPVQCKGKATWNLDISASYKIGGKMTIYGNVLNVLGINPPFDPAAAYSATQYNPAWAQPNIVGRYFRVGVKLDF